MSGCSNVALAVGSEVVGAGVGRVGASIAAKHGDTIFRMLADETGSLPAGLLVPWVKGEHARGVLVAAGTKIELTSGYAGAGSAIRGARGFNRVTWSHVEGHAAAIMHRDGLKAATLFINRAPCSGRNGCGAMLPRMLPPGARLMVHGPGNYDRLFVGLP